MRTAASEKIDQQIASLNDWRAERCTQLRSIVNAAHPDIAEDFKWGTAVWTLNGLVCAVTPFKNHVKINFFKGNLLDDPKNLFNNGMNSKEHRSIDFNENDTIDEPAIAELIKQAIALNQ